MPRQRQPLARHDGRPPHQPRQHVLEQARRGVREQSLARFLARQPVRQRMSAVIGADRSLHQRGRRARRSATGRDQRDCSTAQHPPSATSRATSASAVAESPSRRDRASLRQTRGAALRDQRVTTRPSSGGSSRAQRNAAAGLGPQRAARRLRIEHDAAADGQRRRIRTEDEPVAARQHRRRFEPQRDVAALTGADLVGADLALGGWLAGTRRPIPAQSPRWCPDGTGPACHAAAAARTASTSTRDVDPTACSRATGNGTACRRAPRRRSRRRRG